MSALYLLRRREHDCHEYETCEERINRLTQWTCNARLPRIHCDSQLLSCHTSLHPPRPPLPYALLDACMIAYPNSLEYQRLHESFRPQLSHLVESSIENETTAELGTGQCGSTRCFGVLQPLPALEALACLSEKRQTLRWLHWAYLTAMACKHHCRPAFLVSLAKRNSLHIPSTGCCPTTLPTHWDLLIGRDTSQGQLVAFSSRHPSTTKQSQPVSRSINGPPQLQPLTTYHQWIQRLRRCICWISNA